ncbi:MAG: hypothetical protein VR68_01085 [Peptococcaceae bacterium BRH_c4a]|nr:MAG: hypothetical protein VR68_01085 [Peptococcaceae bacterium BRH_c4a]
MKPVGFIGLGAMGKPMAKNLVKAGYSLVVYDVNPSPVEELVSLGAVKADCSREVAEACETLVTMMPNSPHVEAVLMDPDGVLAGLASGGIIIDMSTIAPNAAKNFAGKAAAQGVTILDAPVTGGVVGAVSGTLTIMVGGPKEALDRVMPLLEAMGKTIVHVGPSGAGQTVKMANQIMVGISYAAVAEAWTIGVKAGADPTLMYEVLSKGAARCFAIERVPDTVLPGSFEPGFMIDLQHKDLCIAMETSKELNIPLNLTSIALQYYEAARCLGFGRKDHSAVIKVLEHITNVDTRAKTS